MALTLDRPHRTGSTVWGESVSLGRMSTDPNNGASGAFSIGPASRFSVRATSSFLGLNEIPWGEEVFSGEANHLFQH
ncbi:hypothetical protein PVAP13_8KG160001 [Panicum virgatum]|uniref:Uncharacterized protein n=1 Tax=Panicum virgatum TaxID=38727 RepID=A0A8T0PIF2_PANVG|nr:hypothetical protein PVAP13_8KG160001 [Panicum virgatum]